MKHRWVWLVVFSCLMFSGAALALTTCWQESNTAELLSAHARNVAETVNRINANLLMAESSVRGYMDTGNEVFLRGYYRSETKAKDLIDVLDSLLFKNDEQRHRLVHLRELVERKLEWEHNLVITCQQTGLPAADSLAKTLTGFKLMQEVGSELKGIRANEISLANKYTRESLSYNLMLLVVGGLLSAIGAFTTASAIKLRRLSVNLEKDKERAYERLQLLYQELNSRVVSLLQAQEDAGKALKVRSEFVARVSHELRTPLSGVIGATELVLSMPQPPEQRELILTAKKCGERLLALVNDILDFERIELHGLRLDLKNFALRQTVEEALEPLHFKAKDKKLVLTLEVSDDVPEQVCGDAIRLQQILVNLVDNAIKFTEQGSVCVKLSSDSTSNNQALLRFKVTDTGAGIAQELLSRLFEPFFQVDGSSTRQHGGSGLGLTVSNRLAQLMKGKIEVFSKPGQGSEFVFVVPLALADNHHAVSESTIMDNMEAGISLPILIVDDDRQTRKIIAAQFKRLGYDVNEVDSGIQAVNCSLNGKYALIVMDVEMPDMDGIEATKIIRSMPGNLCRDVPIIALTAYAMPEDRERCLSAGMNAHIAKPVTLETLRQITDAWIPESKSVSSHVSPFNNKRKCN